MKKHLKEFESGQAIILIAVAVVGLLGAVALAVDGSMIYSDRNTMQGDADNTVMSAAGAGAIELDTQGVYALGFSCSDEEVVLAMIAARDAAIARAAQAGYEVDADISDGNGVQVTCSVEQVEGYYDRYFDVNVKITDFTDTAFTSVLFPQGIANTVETASRIRPRRMLALGNAIASLEYQCTDGITMEGTVNVVIYDGGIFSNTCLNVQGTVDVELIVDYGDISYVSSYTNVGNTTVSPAPIQVDETIPILKISPPDCASLPYVGDVSLSGGSTTLNSGRYGFIKVTGGTLTFNPGLYCLSSDMEISGNSLTQVAGDMNDPSGVTFYMSAGGITFNGNSEILLRAPSVNQPPALKGMLFLAPLTNTSTFLLTGNHDSFFRGTVYIPGASLEARGNGNVNGWYTELVGGTVSLGGTADLIIHSTNEYNYTRPPMVELLK